MATADGKAVLTHFDESGASRMVDVSAKEASQRMAVAGAVVTMQPDTFRLILDRKFAKGDVLEVARIAGIQAAKRCSDLIPLCHPLMLDSVKVDFEPDPAASAIAIFARVGCTGRTGVEMEALTSVTVAALTIYDMCKAVDRAMVIDRVRLLEKMGGKSGHFRREEEA